MVGSFKFNGIDSSSFNLVCKSVKRPLLPPVKIRRVEIAGSSGAYDFDGNEYSLREITMRISYIGKSYNELRSRARDIAAWLGVGGWSKLIINDELDKYYLAKVTSEIDLQGMWEAGIAEITFDCQPFAYSIDNQVIIFSADKKVEYVFNNPGTRLIDNKSPIGSYFIIKIEGVWSTLDLSVGGKTLIYDESGSGILTIDNIEMEVFLGTLNKFNILSGDVDDFLRILPGDNVFIIDGSNIDVEVTIEFIPMWL